jgi:hypothetical protein
MTKKYFIILSLLVLLSLVSVNAAIITVNSAGGAAQTTISGALAAAAPNDTINIIGGGPYDEIIRISKPVTLQGFGYRPILCVQLNAAATTANTGLEINADGIVNLNNLTILPSLTAPPTAGGVIVNASGVSTCVANLNNLLLCPNNGANLPVTTDGLSLVDLTGATPITQPVVAARVGGIANLTDVIISNNRTAGATGRTDGFLNYGSAGFSTVGEGCVISYNDGFGCQLNSPCKIQGSASKPVRIIGNCQLELSQPYGAIANFDILLVPITISIDYCIIDSNPTAGIDEEGSTNSNISPISHTIISNQTGPGIRNNGAGGNMVLQNVTFFNNTGGVMTINDTDQAVDASNVIFAGTGNQTDATNVITFNSTNTLTISNSALLQSGPYSLNTTNNGIAGSGTAITQTAVITANPNFYQTNPLSNEFLNVSNTYYWNKGPGGIALVGGALFAPAFGIAPLPPVIVTLGQTKLFTTVGSIGPYSGWTTSNPAVGVMTAIADDTANFLALSVGSTQISVTDGNGYTYNSPYLSVLATSAPLFIDAVDSKEVRFEMFE